MTSFWHHAETFPPILVRLLARSKGGPPLTTEEIAQRSGGELNEWDVMAISSCPNWDAIPLGRMRAFLRATDTDFCDRTAMKRKTAYLRTKHKFRYLIRSSEWETILRPLSMKFRQQQTKPTNEVLQRKNRPVVDPVQDRAGNR